MLAERSAVMKADMWVATMEETMVETWVEMMVC
jgi:hypothetical protein